MRIYLIWRSGYDNERIMGAYDDPSYCEERLEAFMKADKEQEYTWMMTSYDIQQRSTTEK